LHNRDEPIFHEAVSMAATLCVEAIVEAANEAEPAESAVIASV
jgi:hypothetical protein